MTMMRRDSERRDSDTCSHRICRRALLLLAVPLLAVPAAGAADPWMPLGPEGAVVPALAAGPDRPGVVWAGTATGSLFRSDDGGSSWSLAGRLPGRPRIETLAVGPGEPAVLWAAVGFEPIPLLRSESGGATWAPVGPPRTANQLLVVPGSPVTLLAVSWGERRLERSLDGGLTWSAVDAGLPAGLLRLTAEPGSPGDLWASVVKDTAAGPKVFRSTDAGTTWTPASEGLPPEEDVTLLAASSGTLYALVGPRFSAARQRVFRRAGGAGSWSPAGPEIPQELFDRGDPVELTADPEQPSRLYLTVSGRSGGRVLASDDGGASFRATAVEELAGATMGELLPVPGSGGDLLVSAGALGVFAGSAGGEVWRRSSQGLAAAGADALAATRGEPTTVYAAVFGRVLASTDGGAVWRETPQPPFLSIGSLVPDPADPSTLYGLGSGIARTRDGGATWEVLPADLGCLVPTVLAIAPSAPDTLYVSGFPIEVPCGGCGLFRSTDAGETWSCADGGGAPGYASALAVLPRDPDTAYAAGNGIYKTHDGGESWVRVSDEPRVTGLLIDPRGPTGYAATERGGVLREDGGIWRPASLGLPEGVRVEELVLDPVSPVNLYAALGPGGVFTSADGAESWRPLGEGLPEESFVGSLAVDPVTPSILYAGTRGDGVFRLARREPHPCIADATTLCLNEGRFEVKVGWRDFQGGTGAGQAMPVTGDTGSFWFFAPDNVELAVKVLDARPVNGYFWLFYGSLSNVEYTLVVTDTETGESRGYFNPAERFASVGDVRAFPLAEGGTSGPALRARSGEGEAPLPGGSGETTGDPCTPSATTLCLNDGRFRVEVAWEDFQGGSGTGRAIPRTSDSGFFWFFDPDNVELVVKVIDGRPANQHFWFFYGALSNVGYEIAVTDTATGRRKVYANPSGTFASIGDTAAFEARGELCGGFAGLPCPVGQICDLPSGSCNFADLFGTCVERPEACVAVFDPVCGCDGVTYGNDCERLLAGVTRAHDGACGSVRLCSVPSGPACGEGEYCEPPPGTCDLPGLIGVCEIQPDACALLPNTFPVCGCDGVTYYGDCFRQVEGVALDHEGACRGS